MVAASTSMTEAQSAPYQGGVALTGPSWHSHRHLTHGPYVLLAQPTVHIGCMESNDIVLSDPLASRHHAVIRWTSRGYEIEDLGSTAGTFVQGERIDGPTLLQPGHRIRIGTTELHFQALEGHHHAGGLLPHAESVATVAAIPAHVFDALALHARRTPFGHWVTTQRRKHYWRVFLGTLCAYLVSVWIVSTTHFAAAVPMTLILASALVPITFVIFCWEEGAFVDMPATVVGLTFISGALLGLALAWLLETYLASGEGVGVALMIGVCEETAKAVAVLWFLRDRRLRSELDGLVLGAAAGMGFATLETMGYGFASFLDTYTSIRCLTFLGHQVPCHQLDAAIGTMTNTLNARMELAIFGHGLWTAILITTIWRERRGSFLRLTPGVVLAFTIAVGLHGLWDAVPDYTDSVLPLLAIGVVGLFILRFFVMEAVERAKLGANPPPPPSLFKALGLYVRHPIHGRAP